jgi:purine-binding chemotaxis protein CheW
MGPSPAAGEASVQPSGQEPELPQEQELEMLAFLLGTEEYVVPVDRVREVLTPREVTPVPHAPDHILGVCSLRGAVLPLVDLRRRLGLGRAAGDEKSRIVVVSLGPDDTVGLAVDRVRGVVRIAPSSLRPAPETVEEGGELLKGIARKDDRLLILLDVEAAVGTVAPGRQGK